MSKKIKDPSKKAPAKKSSLNLFEWVWYILCGGLGLWGLTYIVLGLVAENLPIEAEDGQFVETNNKFASIFGLDWLGWGLIILAIACVSAVVVLLIFSNKSDRDYEKNTRRAARLAQLEAEEEKEEQQVVDAEVNEPSSENKE